MMFVLCQLFSTSHLLMFLSLSQDAEEEPTLEGEPASNRGQVAAEGVVKGTADGAVGSDASVITGKS